MAEFISIDQTTTRKAANRFRDAAKSIEQDAGNIGGQFTQHTREAIVGIYGPKLGAETNWLVDWTLPAGTLGLLSVKSADPYVLGYEFGTQEHTIVAQNVPMLGFYWYNAGANFLGEAVLHPGARPHNRLPYLEQYMRELGLWGWSRAAGAALKDLGYGYEERRIPPTPRIFQPEEENSNVWQPDAPVIHGRSLVNRMVSDEQFFNAHIGGMLRAMRRTRGR